MVQMAWRYSTLGRSTKNMESQRPARSNSGGNWDTSLAVATRNTGAVFSCIQDNNGLGTTAARVVFDPWRVRTANRS